MFGNLGQLAGLLKNAGQIKQNMQAMQERMAATRFEGEAGGGQVRSTVDGRGEIVAVKIDPALVQAGDIEMIEDLVCAAIRDAIKRSREAMQKEMQALTGGMGLPDMDNLLGGLGK
jgi:DNA-binding YbaB/EbfC family protein